MTTTQSGAPNGRRYAYFNDPHAQRWRTRDGRRRLVLLGLLYPIGVSVLSVAVTSLLQGNLALGLGLPAAAGGWWWFVDRLRVATRGMTALPSEVLDERQRESRAHAYERAYRALFAGVVALVALLLAWRLVPLADEALWLGTMVIVLLGYAAPTLIAAWTEPGEPLDAGA